MRQMSSNTFLRTETGAVTVDWVVLTASLVGLGLATMTMVSRGTQDASEDIDAQLGGLTIRTSFSVLQAVATAYDFASGIGGFTNVGGPGTLTHKSGAGSDGQAGYLEYFDTGSGVSFMSLPSDHSGDMTSLYGGSIGFDIKTLADPNNTGNINGGGMVRIYASDGSFIRMDADAFSPSKSEWSRFEASVTEGDWLNSDGSVATQAQIEAILSDVDDIRIKTDLLGGYNDRFGFDNITVTTMEES